MERDYCYLADANVDAKNTVESAFSLLSAKESNLQVPELTRPQTDDKPTFSLSAYQAMY